jgi:hypothetical protein
MNDTEKKDEKGFGHKIMVAAVTVSIILWVTTFLLAPIALLKVILAYIF